MKIGMQQRQQGVACFHAMSPHEASRHGRRRPGTARWRDAAAPGCVKRSTLYMAVRRAQIVSGFLDWLVRGGYLAANPFAEIRCMCRRQSTAAIVRALVSS